MALLHHSFWSSEVIVTKGILYQPGRWVRVKDPPEGFEQPLGVIVERRDSQNGCLVRPLGSASTFGWGFNELDLLDGPPPELPTRFDREDPV